MMKLKRYVFGSLKKKPYEFLITGETDDLYLGFNDGNIHISKDEINIISQKDSLDDLSKSELLLYAQKLEHSNCRLQEIFNFNQENVDIRLDEILDKTYNFLTYLLNK